jgi:hypothetical protein
MMIWNTLGAFFGSLIATGIVARFTQKWIEHRERRHRRDELRLELYLEVVDLVPHNEVFIAELSSESASTPIELQQKRLRIGHRLKLLGSPAVREAYDNYNRLVYETTDHPVEHRPRSDEVVRARDRLVDAMAKDVQEA